MFAPDAETGQPAEETAGGLEGYNYAFLDEHTKREIRRKILKAVAIPGHQVPFGSREMPIARGWGTGGLQITLSLVGPDDVLKVIDQGDDLSVNAANIRRFVALVTGVRTTSDTAEATVIQTRHRIPEEPLRADQTLVLQVPLPEPLRLLEPSEERTRLMHAEADYTPMWLFLYENIVRYDEIMLAAGYPVRVNGRYMMSPSPIPRWDIPKLNMAENLFLFGAGREKRIYAVPPHTLVEPLGFDDYPFRPEDFQGLSCSICGSSGVFLEEVVDEKTGFRIHRCSDTSYCRKMSEVRP